MLGGKRACVMIFDCYFGISTTIEPINVRTVDRRLQLISDKQLCHEFDLGKLETPQPEPGEKLQRFIEETKADEKGYPLCWIAEPDARSIWNRSQFPRDYARARTSGS